MGIVFDKMIDTIPNKHLRTFSDVLDVFPRLVIDLINATAWNHIVKCQKEHPFPQVPHHIRWIVPATKPSQGREFLGKKEHVLACSNGQFESNPAGHDIRENILEIAAVKFTPKHNQVLLFLVKGIKETRRCCDDHP